MLGIDIVDLNDKQSKRRDERSLSLIQHKDDVLIPHRDIFWLLWAAKEATYKCWRKEIDFSPTSISVSIKQNKNEPILFQSGAFEGFFQVEKSFILAVCSDRIQSINYIQMKEKHHITSKGIRENIKKYFKEIGKDFEIGADYLGLPILLPILQPISVSHHHRLGAFAFDKSILS